MATIRIPPILRPEAGGLREVELSGATVRALLESLVATYPALQERILAGDELPQFLNVFVDGSDVRLLDGLDTPVSDSTTLILLPAVAGGSSPPDPQAEPFALDDDRLAVRRSSVPAERRGPVAAVPVGGAAREVRVAVDDTARIRLRAVAEDQGGRDPGEHGTCHEAEKEPVAGAEPPQQARALGRHASPAGRPRACLRPSRTQRRLPEAGRAPGSVSARSRTRPPR